jgi:hypothetical protein
MSDHILILMIIISLLLTSITGFTQHFRISDLNKRISKLESKIKTLMYTSTERSVSMRLPFPSQVNKYPSDEIGFGDSDTAKRIVDDINKSSRQ